MRSAKQDAWRTEPLARKVAYARRQGEPVAGDASPEVVDETLERIFKNADFLPGWWLTTGAKRADAVAKLTTALEMGTGFLVSPWLLMTNHHVLDSVETAADTIAWFRYVEDEDGASQPTKVALQPERCFVTSPADDLDFTLVAVAPVDDKPPSETFGYIALHGGVGKIVKGQSVNVIQHPQGRHREVTLRNNTFSGPLVDAQGVENPEVPALRRRHRAGLVRGSPAQRHLGAHRPAPRERAEAQRPGAVRRPRRQSRRREHP